MKQNLIKKPLSLFIAASLAVALTGCGDATTNIEERDPQAGDDHDHDHGHAGEGGDTPAGRLLVLNSADVEAEVYDLADSDLITTIALDAVPSAVYASGDYRFASLVERSADKVSFIDGGLYQEPHDDHFDLVTAMPELLNFSLTGSRPTHFVQHEGQIALFLDGDSTNGINAGVQVFDDHTIEEGEAPVMLEHSMPMHGVAEPRGDILISTIRRDDADSTSSNFILPDQVGVYHLHDGEYELEETFAAACPDLHGAAQNETHVIFGCSDGVLIVADNGDETFTAEKLPNSEDVIEGLRIGSLYGHHASGQFIGRASSRGSSDVQFFAINPEESEMELIDWQPEENAAPVASGFTFEAEQFLILDDQGHVTVIEPHLEGDHTHWEFGTQLVFSEADVSTMPDGMRFTMTFAPNAHMAYIADPIEQHVRILDLELMDFDGDIELDYAPASITWLGIAEGEPHEH